MKKFVNSLHCHEISNNRNNIFQFCHFLCNITYKNAIKDRYICSFTAFLYIITNFSGFIDILDLPVDRLHSVCRQKCIRLAKMLASEKAIVCRQRTWMCRFQDQMFGPLLCHSAHCGVSVLHCGFTVLHCGVTVLHCRITVQQRSVTVLPVVFLPPL